MMTVDHRQDHLETIRSSLSAVLYPLQALVHLPFQGIDWAAHSLASRRALVEENTTLRAQNLLYKAQVHKFAALENENMRLRELLESSLKVSDRVLIAELLRVNMEPFTHQITLNKGSGHDIFVGQPLIDADGVMGQIVHVGPLSSAAMLVTDPSHALPVQINRNGLRAIAVGTGAFDRLELLHIPSNADIQVGDLLVTSGLAGRFPPGYPVATISAVEIDPGLRFARVLAEPLARLQRTREVLLVWPAKTDIPTAHFSPAQDTPAEGP
jgi:rod shape-determining protein MreC